MTCIGALAGAVGEQLAGYISLSPMQVSHPQGDNNFLELALETGLSSALTRSLTAITNSLPMYLEPVQERLLDIISIKLCGAPFLQSGQVGNAAMSPVLTQEQAGATSLALRTLASFNWERQALTQFVHDVVVVFLELPQGNLDDNLRDMVRRDAAAACCRVVVQAADVPLRRGYTTELVDLVLQRVLAVAIADPSVVLRLTVLELLHGDKRFDHLLCQPHHLRPVFLALNDEVFEVRQAVLRLLGRLMPRNPACIMPALRKILFQLLAEIEHSADRRGREEATRLIGHVTQAGGDLIRPYVRPMMKIMLPRLRDSSSGITSCIFEVVGCLAEVRGEDMQIYVDELIPLIIDSLQDSSAASRKEIAFHTLGLLAANTGCVIVPYLRHPRLMDIILASLSASNAAALRFEAAKVLGVLGAVDPHKYKHTSGSNGVVAPTTPGHVPRPADTSSVQWQGPIDADADEAEFLAGIGPSHDEYYPSVSIISVRRILKDPSLSQHQNVVVQAMQGLIFIFRSLGLKSSRYLPFVMPMLFQMIEGSERDLREFLFQELHTIVKTIKHHSRNYLPQLVDLIRTYWGDQNLLPHLIALIEQLSLAIQDDFKAYLPELIPQLLSALHPSGGHSSTQPSLVTREAITKRVLDALRVFGTHLNEFLYLVIPTLVKLIEQPEHRLALRHQALQSLVHFTHVLSLSEYVSRIVHPLIRILTHRSTELHGPAIAAICGLVHQLGPEFAIFVPTCRKAMAVHNLNDPTLESLFKDLTAAKRRLPISDTESSGAASGRPSGEAQDISGSNVKLAVNQANLKKAWETSQRSTKEDWNDWIRRFSIELLRESPSPALRSCGGLIQVHKSLARELFNTTFVSCWTELYDGYQDQLVESLERALSSPNIPTEILQDILNLAEFMEHDDKPLPIDIRKLGKVAERCHAYAKALHYKETEFMMSPQASTVESLISINNRLQQPEAALGILQYGQMNLGVNLQEAWYEKLHRWEDALRAYEKRCGGTVILTNGLAVPSEADNLDIVEEVGSDDGFVMTTAPAVPEDVDAVMGRMRCLEALSEWEQLASLAQQRWSASTRDGAKEELAGLGASAALMLGKWDVMGEYAEAISPDSTHGTFYRAVLAVHRGDFVQCRGLIQHWRQLGDVELMAHVGEGYYRAYKVVVAMQQLTEVEEIMSYKEHPERHSTIRQMWRDRLYGCQRSVGVWERFLAVRSVVVPPIEDLTTWLKFSALCRKAGRLRLAYRTLANLVGAELSLQSHILPDVQLSKQPLLSPEASIGTDPRIRFSHIKILWADEHRNVAFAALTQLLEDIPDDPYLRAKCLVKRGKWRIIEHGEPLDRDVVADILNCFHTATELRHDYYKAWHSWAWMNYQVVLQVEKDFKDHHHPLNSSQSPQGVALATALAQTPDSAEHKKDTGLIPPTGTGNEEQGEEGIAAKQGSDVEVDSQVPKESDDSQTDTDRQGVTDRKDSLSSSHDAMMHAAAANPSLSRPADSVIWDDLDAHVAPAIHGFFKSIALGSEKSLQDILRLLTLWFKYGHREKVEIALKEGFDTLPIDTWLQVIPQIIARIHINNAQVRNQISDLLSKVGRSHPQAIIYSLTVASKSQTEMRKMTTLSIMETMREHSPKLVEQAALVSQELIRVAILWQEMWAEALEEASRLYFGDHNVEGMLACLAPLHEMMQKGPHTVREEDFERTFGRELQQAHEWCKKYQVSKREQDLNQAWDLYYQVFRRVSKQLQQLTRHELRNVSPRLLEARNLELAVPGTYQPGHPIVAIASFSPTIQVCSALIATRYL